tara:strand:- start:2537 stop:2695 length:159 start_codon:yes stop_codon:yes gene_type:complete
MGKKISKNASTIRTISLAVGSLSLVVIAFAQIAEKEVCTSNSYLSDYQIGIS